MKLQLFGPLVAIHISSRGLGFEFDIGVGPIYPFVVGPSVNVRLYVGWLPLSTIVAPLVLVGLGIAFRDRLGQLSGLPGWAHENWRFASGIAVGLGIGAAFGLATWKRRNLLSYAVGELLAGAFSIYHTTAAFWPAHEVAKVVGIASSLYLISRGFGNLFDAAGM